MCPICLSWISEVDVHRLFPKRPYVLSQGRPKLTSMGCTEINIHRTFYTGTIADPRLVHKRTSIGRFSEVRPRIHYPSICGRNFNHAKRYRPTTNKLRQVKLTSV